MRRLHSLDGLRGVAALVVLVMHVLLTSEAFAPPVLRLDSKGAIEWWQWMLLYTPLHALWDGSVAVYIFFVLSGVVLTIPILNRRGSFDWLSYYPKRLIRLYVPVWVAVALGTAIALLVPRRDNPDLGSWLSSRPDPSLVGFVKDLFLMGGPSDVISPLWTLQWEVLFSLALPVYIWFCVRLLLPAWLKLALIGAAIAGGLFLGFESVAYLSMFAIGSVLATLIPRIGASRGGWVFGALAIAALVLVSSRWIALGWGGTGTTLVALRFTAVAGAAVIVYLAVAWAPLDKLLSSRAAQWLGLVSFSLYLIHEPIVLGVAYTFGTRWAWLAIPISLVAAWGFQRIVEGPSHRLARWVGTRFLSRPATRVSANS
jgi:peptidoglycan/LPS O-acetylase OafA/YrhL